MLKTIATKILSILTSAALLLPSLAGSSSAIGTPAVPDFVRACTPASHLGYLESYYQGQSEHPVILIEDLHANYGVQKKIIGILKHLQAKVMPAGHPMVIGEEAAWGPVDLSYMRQGDPKQKELISDFLMTEAEMNGAEKFAWMSRTPVTLAGIDSQEDYMLHLQLVRRSAMARFRLARKVEDLHELVNSSKGKAPRALRKLMAAEEAFHKGEIDLPELALQLDVPSLTSYGAAEAALYNRKLALASQEKEQKAFFLKNLVKAEQDLNLLSRLLREQLTLEEVQFASRQVPEMLTILTALMPGQNLQEWKEVINEAIDYYAVALMRDKPLAEHALALIKGEGSEFRVSGSGLTSASISNSKLETRNTKLRHDNDPVVVVTGGFHTSGIAQLLRAKNLSYVIIAPVVESQTSQDELLYLRRILGEELTESDIETDGRAYMTAHALAIQTLLARGRAVFGRTVETISERVITPLRSKGAAKTTDNPPRLHIPPMWESDYGTYQRSIAKAQGDRGVLLPLQTEGQTYNGLPIEAGDLFPHLRKATEKEPSLSFAEQDRLLTLINAVDSGGLVYGITRADLLVLRSLSLASSKAPLWHSDNISYFLKSVYLTRKDVEYWKKSPQTYLGEASDSILLSYGESDKLALVKSEFGSGYYLVPQEQVLEGVYTFSFDEYGRITLKSVEAGSEAAAEDLRRDISSALTDLSNMLRGNDLAFNHHLRTIGDIKVAVMSHNRGEETFFSPNGASVKIHMGQSPELRALAIAKLVANLTMPSDLRKKSHEEQQRYLMPIFARAAIQQVGVQAIIDALATLETAGEPVPLRAFFVILQQTLIHVSREHEMLGLRADDKDVNDATKRRQSDYFKTTEGQRFLQAAVEQFLLESPAVKEMLRESEKAGGLLLPVSTQNPKFIEPIEPGLVKHGKTIYDALEPARTPSLYDRLSEMIDVVLAGRTFRLSYRDVLLLTEILRGWDRTDTPNLIDKLGEIRFESAAGPILLSKFKTETPNRTTLPLQAYILRKSKTGPGLEILPETEVVKGIYRLSIGGWIVSTEGTVGPDTGAIHDLVLHALTALERTHGMKLTLVDLVKASGGELTIIEAPHDVIEETRRDQFGRYTIIIDQDLPEPLKIAAVTKLAENVLFSTGWGLLTNLAKEEAVFPKFIEAMALQVGLPVLAAALRDSKATLGPGVEPLLNLLEALAETDIGKETKQKLKTQEKEDQAGWLHTNLPFVQYLVDLYLMHPEVRNLIQVHDGLLLPVSTGRDDREGDRAEQTIVTEKILENVPMAARAAGAIRKTAANLRAAASAAFALLRPTKGQEARRRAARAVIDAAA